jgi:hypothetical protein
MCQIGFWRVRDFRNHRQPLVFRCLRLPAIFPFVAQNRLCTIQVRRSVGPQTVDFPILALGVLGSKRWRLAKMGRRTFLGNADLRQLTLLKGTPSRSGEEQSSRASLNHEQIICLQASQSVPAQFPFGEPLRRLVSRFSDCQGMRQAIANAARPTPLSIPVYTTTARGFR